MKKINLTAWILIALVAGIAAGAVFPEMVKFRHILLKADASNDKQVKAKIDDLAAQLKKGANFADLAKQYSEDTESAPNGGDLGWLGKGQKAKELVDKAFSLSENQTSDPFKTADGYHIIQVEDKKSGASIFAILGTIFLRLIKSIIAPLLFATLVHGIAGTGNVKTMGRIGGKAILYFEIVTTVALFIGLGSANLIQPGIGVELQKGAAAGVAASNASFSAILEHTFPVSIIDSMARGEVLQIVVFAFIFGAACASIGLKARPVVEFCESLAEVMFRYTNYVMLFAPLGVFGAMAATIAENGLGVMVNLGKLVATLYSTEAFFVVVVLGSVMLLLRIPVRRFIRYAREPFLLAFSTASSESALPLALRNMEAFGVPKHIVSFVLPTGYSFNLDGSTLYLSLAAMFIAQAANVHLAFTTQIVMMLTLMLTSKGVAGVPRASLVILAGTLSTFNLPIEGIAVILGVDTLMDMARTSVNLLGNCLATAVVARWEGVNLAKAGELDGLAQAAAAAAD